MSMKKIFNSGAPFIIGNDEGDKKLFPPGFRYRMGSIIYTVKADVTQEAASPMREIFLSDGATEITPVESILKDMKEIQNSNNITAGEIMDPDERFMPKQVVEKVAKKRVKKKKVKKVVKKKGLVARELLVATVVLIMAGCIAICLF